MTLPFHVTSEKSEVLTGLVLLKDQVEFETSVQLLLKTVSVNLHFHVPPEFEIRRYCRCPGGFQHLGSKPTEIWECHLTEAVWQSPTLTG